MCIKHRNLLHAPTIAPLSEFAFCRCPDFHEKSGRIRITADVLCVSTLDPGVIFSIFWVLGGGRWELIWQPAIIAALFVLGLAFTFAAIEKGDVSIATPIFGVKVVFVAFPSTLMGLQDLPTSVWQAAIMATVGIGPHSVDGNEETHHVTLTISLALYARFHMPFLMYWCSVGRLAGVGGFLPIVYWMVGLSSTTPTRTAVENHSEEKNHGTTPCRQNANFPAAICIVSTLAIFGDAARVNVVYSLRGLWGSPLSASCSKEMGRAEAEQTRGTMMSRLAGAVILAAAVTLVVLSEIAM